MWKPVEGFKGYYVNRSGQVLSRKRGGKERILKAGLSGCGYLNVVLMKDNKRICKKVHRLVAENFIERIIDKDFVNHKNGTKTDNNLGNLEWCNRSENVRHAIKAGLIKSRKGQVGTLSDCQILALITLPKTTSNGRLSLFTNRDIAKEWAVAESLISKIRNHKQDIGKMNTLYASEF